MKLDGDVVPSINSNTNPFLEHDEVSNTFEEKAAKEIKKENQSGLSCDIRENERDTNPFRSEMGPGDDGFWLVSESLGSEPIKTSSWEESMNFEAPLAPYSQFNKQLEFPHDDRNPFSDKNFNELDMPELLVCYNEKSYVDVKDICVDESVPSEKILFEAEKDAVAHSIDEKADYGIANGNLSTRLKDISMEDPVSKPSSDDHMQTNAKTNEAADDGHGLDTPPLAPEFPVDEVHPKPSHNLGRESTQYAKEESNKEATSGKPSSFSNEHGTNCCNAELAPRRHSADNHEVEGEILDEEAVLGGHILPEKPKDETHPHVNESSCNGHSEKSGNAHDDALEPEPSSGKTSSPDDSGKDAELHNLPKTEGVFNGRGDPSQDNQSFSGETSFSAAGPVSGRITFSGPIAYSGSLSLRSESSTTSTRSFAFPILQSEWNYSPVRMTKADKRRLRKQRGWRWRQGLLCCKF